MPQKYSRASSSHRKGLNSEPLNISIVHVLRISSGSWPCSQFSVLTAQRTALHRNGKQCPCEIVAEHYYPWGRKKQNPRERAPAQQLFLAENYWFCYKTSFLWIQSWHLCRLRKDSPWSHMLRHCFVTSLAWHLSSVQSKDTRDILLNQNTP